jgi:hypothetical protein
MAKNMHAPNILKSAEPDQPRLPARKQGRFLAVSRWQLPAETWPSVAGEKWIYMVDAYAGDKASKIKTGHVWTRLEKTVLIASSRC